VVSAIAFLDRTNISVAGVEMRKDYGIDQVHLGWVFSAFLIGYALFQSAVLSVVIHAVVRALDAATGASAHGVVARWSFAAQLVLFVVSHDLYIYWFHRAQHRIPLLWRLHEAHHAARLGLPPPPGTGAERAASLIDALESVTMGVPAHAMLPLACALVAGALVWRWFDRRALWPLRL